jgi:hypothetical protein
MIGFGIIMTLSAQSEARGFMEWRVTATRGAPPESPNIGNLVIEGEPIFHRPAVLFKSHHCSRPAHAN